MAETYEYVEASAASGGAKFATQQYTISANSVDFPVSLLGMFVSETTIPIAARAGQQTMANSLAVVLASDHSNVPVNIAASGVDLMLGTDFSGVFGTASLVATDGAAALTKGLHLLGTDGTNAQILKTDSNGEAQVDVLTLPSLPAGTNNIGDVDVLTFPTTVHSEDYDTGAGTDTTLCFGIALPASGGAVAGGTATNPVRTDPTGSTTQPVSGTVTVQDGGGSITVDGTVTANAGTGTFTVDTPDGSIAIDELPAAAALADNTANPTTTLVGSCLLGFDGATWDRIQVGGGTEASALRVTLANDSTGVVSVDDNGGSLTVDGTVTANQGTAQTAANGWPIRASDGTNLINIGDNTNSAVRVNVVAGSAAGTEFNEDSAHTSGDAGTLVLGVRNDAGGTMVDTDGDYHPLQFDSSGRLRVVTQGGAGGTSSVDDAAFTVGTDSGTPMMGLVDETAPDNADEGDVAVPRITSDRKLLIRLVGATDTNRLDVDSSGHAQVDIAAASVPVPVTDNGGSLTVDGTVTANAGTGTFTVDTPDGSIGIDELPAAAALADNASNPTTTLVGACLLGFDGATWDRVQVGGGAEAAALRVTIANDSTGVVSVDDNGASLTIDNATLSVTGGGTEASALRVTLANDSTGVVSVDDNGGSLTVDGTVTANAGTGPSTPWDVQDKAATSGGLSMHKTISAATTNATSVKASAGQLYAVEAYNTNASARYLKLYDKASAPTVGTDTPVKTLLIPGNTAGAGFVINWDKGLVFSSGIAFALTTGIADSDTGAVGANEIAVNLDYK